MSDGINNHGDLMQLSKSVVRLQVQVENLEKLVEDLVTKAEFAPVKLIAYGLATGAMSAVVMAVISKVIVP
jgi:hypothetical protein